MNNLSKVDDENIFQPIDSDEKKSSGYVYSAYFDDRKHKKVVVIALLQKIISEVNCIVYFPKSFLIRKIKPVWIPEGSNLKYIASLINCPIGKEMPEIPIHVSIVINENDRIHNCLNVNLIPKNNLRNEISVCVTPLNMNYNNVDQLIEMLSINELLGASQIFFYNYSIGNETAPILEEFIDRKFVTLLPWKLPMDVNIWPLRDKYVEEVKYFGQMAMLNDCLYRNMGRYKYVAFADLDEYLVPRRHNNWHELIKEIIDRQNPKSVGLMFRNIFFKTEWPSDPQMENNETIASLKAMSLLKVQREETIYLPYQRSKLIVKTLAIDIMGVHNIWAFNMEDSITILNEEDGLNHHYRFWEGLGEKSFVIDKNILRLRENLIRILQKNRKLFL